MSGYEIYDLLLAVLCLVFLEMMQDRP